LLGFCKDKTALLRYVAEHGVEPLGRLPRLLFDRGQPFHERALATAAAWQQTDEDAALSLKRKMSKLGLAGRRVRLLG
jgi:hypothetical protein